MQQMNDLRRIDLNLLVILDALLAEQHVTRAAERLHLSQPAVSHALGRLRDLLADPLLVRVGGGLTPTPRALELQRPLAEALGRVQALLAPQGFDPGTAQRSFRLAMSDYGAASLLPTLTRALREQAPGIDLEISQGSRETMLEQLQNGEIDLAAGVFPELPDNLRSTSLFEEGFACLVDRNSLPAQELDLASYLARPHVLVEMSGGGAAEIERALTRIRERRRIAVRLPHWSVAPQLIAGTDLILTVASRVLRRIDMDHLAVVPPPFELPGITFDLAWHQRTLGDPALDWLRGQVQVAAA
ncbi:LysR family transcriptional regulator [Metapseudomonas lalkuanensis]|uniref:LysR family transcriptional regulator n=1 Tax=Metapseudomonas lalkuanensis TaxID=2604832 RepID=A0A5J6QI91_9GAMM|nr:LysR family transcriptional regulator [Pseudomonas lalkuanensis]QEY62217.1 LysR family transcriptional regulator [Pseudomonas lalkuanensis]